VLTACLGLERKNSWVVIVMRDLAFVLVTALFFCLAIFYLRGCERLK
jgi:hypothetical protein